MDKKIIAIILVIAIVIPLFYFSYDFEDEKKNNIKPVLEIVYPSNGDSFSKMIIIRGVAEDPDGEDENLEIELKIEDKWVFATGTKEWSYEWNVYEVVNGLYTIQVRAFDGIDYSDLKELKIRIENPEIVESDSHKWALFIAVSNFPGGNQSKLGNGPLNLAEEMVDYFIGNLGYSTSNMIILFDDGFIRSDNGYGEPIQTLQERPHKYDITYGGATKDIVESSIKFIIEQANQFEDSEVFIWISSHGLGDESRTLTGGKILQRSAIFLWDKVLLYDDQLGSLLSNLRSKETCILVDACFSGGFADKTILNFPTFFLLKSNVPKPGRVVISGASKYRVGYCSTTKGPLFSQIWFDGIKSGDADGYKPGIFNTGRPTILKIFKDGKVSVEEAFYFARYTLKHDDVFNDYEKMQPQINDQYPNKGLILNNNGLILG